MFLDLTTVYCVPLAVRKTLRTVLHACLQLPENPALPRWFQAEMTFQVSLSDTKRARQVDKMSIESLFEITCSCDSLLVQFEAATDFAAHTSILELMIVCIKHWEVCARAGSSAVGMFHAFSGMMPDKSK